MRPLLLVGEALLAEGASFLREHAAADARRIDPAVRLARRLALLTFALRTLAASLQRRHAGADARALARCRVHVEHDLAIVAKLLRPAQSDALRRLAASAHGARALSLAAACRRVYAEMRTVAALARCADEAALSLWAQRRARHYLRRGLPDAAGSITRTRSRGTSLRTRAASAVNAAMRG